jgi:PKD repeat protein
VALGQSLTFTAAAATNPDGFPLTSSWAFSNGQPTTTAPTLSVAVPMSIAGPVTATLTVLNSVGMPATGVAPTRAVTVTGTPTGNQAPTASISAPAAANTAIAPGATVNFQGSGTDPDSTTPLTYNWSFPGGSPSSSTASSPGLVTYKTAGSYTASLTVTDSLGLASTTVTRTITVAVTGQKPVAVIDTPTINVSLLPGGKVNFKGSAEASANLPLSYNWRFPGASPSSSKVQNPGSISYANAGVFTATLTLTDSKGNQSQAASRVVTVAKPNQTAPLVGQCSIGDSDDDHHDEDDDEEDDEDVKSTTERRSKNEN